MYDRMILIPYVLTGVDMAGGAADISLPLPAGARFARLVEMRAELTEAVVGTTSAPVLQLGTAANTALMATLEIPDGTAVGAQLNSRSDTFSHLGVYQADAAGSELDALQLTIVDAVGGTITGTADVTIVIAVDQALPTPLDA